MGQSTKKMVEKKAKPKTVHKKASAKATTTISDQIKQELATSKILTRGRIFTGKVISTKAAKTVRVEWPRRYYIPKYERFEKRRTRVQAHLPNSISVGVGDQVRISECRPISKTKKFVVIGKLEVKN